MMREKNIETELRSDFICFFSSWLDWEKFILNECFSGKSLNKSISGETMISVICSALEEMVSIVQRYTSATIFRKERKEFTRSTRNDDIAIIETSKAISKPDFFLFAININKPRHKNEIAIPVYGKYFPEIAMYGIRKLNKIEIKYKYLFIMYRLYQVSST